MIKNVQLVLPSGEDGADYILSIAQVDGVHEMALMGYDAKVKGYVLVSDPIYIHDITEMFEVIHDAYDGELSIFLNQYTFEFDYDEEVDNDNQPMIRLVHDEDNTSH